MVKRLVEDRPSSVLRINTVIWGYFSVLFSWKLGKNQEREREMGILFVLLKGTIGFVVLSMAMSMTVFVFFLFLFKIKKIKA